MNDGAIVIHRSHLGYVRGWHLTKSTPHTLVLVHSDTADKAMHFDTGREARRFLAQDNKIVLKYQPELKRAFV